MRLILLVACIFLAFAVDTQGRATAAEAGGLKAQLAAAQAQGTADAARPGDEKLTCEELQAETAVVAQSPEIQAALAMFGDPAQKDLAERDDATQELQHDTRVPSSGQFRSLAQSLAMAYLPNTVGAAAQQAEAMVQAAQMQAQAGKFQQQIFDQAPQLAAMMGPAMRGQRLMDLAEAKTCEWLKGDSLSTPETPLELPPLPAER